MASLLLSARAAAHTIAGVTGYDPRTILKALLEGIERVRPLKMREELRPHVEAWRDEQGLSSAGDTARIVTR